MFIFAKSWICWMKSLGIDVTSQSSAVVLEDTLGGSMAVIQLHKEVGV